MSSKGHLLKSIFKDEMQMLYWFIQIVCVCVCVWGGLSLYSFFLAFLDVLNQKKFDRKKGLYTSLWLKL